MRFGLLGTGPWARNNQSVALATTEGVEFAGVWGRDPVKAAALASEHGTRAYTDVDELFDAVDAVAIALPPDVQADLGVRAASAGRHLLLDKPLALDPAAAQRVVDAVEAAGVTSTVFTTARFVPGLRAFLDETVRTGGWYAAQAVHHSSIFIPGNPYGDSPWRRVHGGLWDVGPHVLSMLVPVLGDVAAVTAVAGPHGTTEVILEHTGGAVSAMSLTVDAAPDAVNRFTVFSGEHGLGVLPSPDFTALDACRLALSELVERAGRPPAERAHPCDVRSGRDTVRVLAAAVESAQVRRTVTLPAR
jgi:predicted dehydrogenase